ncbi:uncharacterized protein K02A2.6-like [Amphibalanus amphitrite]|uniref:uncharacterized protein K02A2.6-like n=1 Tax=Amphibalanus amphitrite TaxID=1232801 RepID=UPI001C91B429|nr:uncharacterized protein K02A2.6-like [Amphibalanus amphitrite]
MSGDSGPPLPAPFLPHPGTPAVPWRNWEQKFELYLLARCGTSPLPPEQRRALLLCAIGDEAYRVFDTLPPVAKRDGEDDYDVTLRQLREFYTPRTNVIVERFRFRQRAQAPTESTADFVAALRGLARTCQFGAMESELIRDVVVEKTPHQRLRERLLQDRDLTLDKVLSVAETYEDSLREAAAISQPVAAPPVSSVAKVTRKPQQKRQQQQQQSSSSDFCTNCGRDDHAPRDAACPARRVTCHSCGKKGHFASWCRGGSGATPARPAQRQHHKAVKELNVLSCAATTGSRLTCTVQVTAGDVTQEVPLQVDTGATCSLLSVNRAKELFRGVAFSPSSSRLYGFGQQPLSVLGTLPTTVTYNNQAVPTNFYLVDTNKTETIMGMDLLQALGVTLHPASHSVYTVAGSAPSELPAIEGYVHRIKLKPDAVPTAYKLRRLPLSVREEVSAELNSLLEAGIIERIDSSQWISPLTVSRKKDGRIRVCVDLRGPNSQIVPEVHPLPTIDELESKLCGTLYSRIDLKSAYHQLRLHEDSRDITAFLTPDGLMRYTRVPFGLVSSGSAFQKLLSHLLQGIDGCGHYLDDILVTGRDQSEHDRRLRTVLDRLKQANVTINTEKSSFSQPEVEFCGHQLSRHGVVPLLSTTKAVAEAPPPTNVKELRSLLGSTGWFSRFVPQYSAVVRPLAIMLKKDATFQWTKEANDAFNEVKRLISARPVMKPFSARLRTIVTTDAESRYSVSEKEALSAVNAVEHWRTYLWGRSFTLRTDHSALTTLLTPKTSNRAGARIARWQSRLLPYSYTVEYRPGRSIPVADALSRLPLPDTGAAETDGDEIVALLTDDVSDVITDDDVCAASAADPVMEQLRSVIRTGWPDAARQCTPETRDYFAVRNELQVRQDGVVLRGPDRAVVPAALRSKYLQLAHRAHDGVVRTKQLLRDLAWWPGMSKDAAALVADCPSCHAKDAVLTQQARPAPLQPVELPDRPWSKLGLDIVGPIPGAPPSAKYAITMTDYHSKWPEVALTSSIETDDVIQFLCQAWSREGLCDELVTDNGPQFTSDRFRQYLAQRGIRHHTSAVYWPRGNGAVERLNREVKVWLKEATQLQSRTAASFSGHMRQRLALYRATPHCTTGQSPSALLHGRRMRLHLPVTTETPPRDSSLQHRVATQQQRNSRGYDSRQATRPSDLQPGDTVRVRRQGHVPKNQSRFSSPRRIARQLGPATFILSDGTKRNASHLARIPDAAPTGSAPPSTDGPEPPPPPPPADPAPPSSGEPQPPSPQPTASTAPPTAPTESARPSDVAEVALPAATGAARDRSPGGPRPPQRAPVGGTPRRELPASSRGRRRFLPRRFT